MLASGGITEDKHRLTDGAGLIFFSKDKAEGVCAYASSRIAEFIESYCNKNNIPVHTHADHKGLEIIINNTDVTE